MCQWGCDLHLAHLNQMVQPFHFPNDGCLNSWTLVLCALPTGHRLLVVTLQQQECIPQLEICVNKLWGTHADDESLVTCITQTLYCSHE
jgi:hypothetical protein